ncbi:DUF4407 domain-containing protein [Sphingobacterium daejeonense]|uniref:DUF4407 domain-containing protein n=1 Tax=Sphingobacterium daejeonense TaxID=371142 RepID=UPI003D32110A
MCIKRQDQNAALTNLHKKPDGTVNKSTEYAVIFIALLFIFFECLPVFVKLMSGRDAYCLLCPSAS